MSTREAFIAANRFGLGPRPGELQAISGDPRGWLAAQIRRDAELPAPLADVASRPSGSDTLASARELRRRGDREAFRNAVRTLIREVYPAEISAKVETLATSEAGFAERMVKFWTNHFTVSTQNKPLIFGLAGDYERNAIRPHIFGRFEDMLLAVARHPAMLVYLDNAISIGPSSIVGRRRGRGLNENFARELLELHTLGVNGGYTQDDVIALAKILTGWMPDNASGRASFRFRAAAHEPGEKLFLGKTYEEAGVAEGEGAIRELAHRPSTARFLATKLVRHFVADDPPPAAVAHIADVYRATGGDLAEVSRALVALDAAWTDPLAKVKTPYELVVSAMRALGLTRLEGRRLMGSLNQLNQVPFRAPSPQGWPDRAADWVAPEALLRRIEWCRVAARLASVDLPPPALADATIGPVADERTLQLIARAPSEADGVALLLASAEFQRR